MNGFSNKFETFSAIVFWGILFAFVAVLVLFLFTLGGKGISEILRMRDYRLSVGVANGLILIAYLMMYRVDAQNIALNENDLEDTEERFKKMTEAYEAEQATLTERVKVLRRELVTAKEETEGVDKFLRIVRKYTEIAELTPETVREFIDRIIVHEAEKTDGKKRQIVEIYYNCVGVIPNPA